MQKKKKLNNRVTHVLLLLVPGLLVFVIDQLAKYAVIQNIVPGTSVGTEYLNISHYQNTGIAFGIPIPQFILYLFIIAVSVLLIYYYKSKLVEPFYAVAISLIAGGAISNIVDRIVHGYVIDYLGILIWPVFNLADGAIVAGVLMLLLKELVLSKKRS